MKSTPKHLKLVAPGRFLVLVATLSLTLYSCASSLQKPKAHGAGKGVECSLVQLKDNQRSGVVAFTYLVPKGWQNKTVFSWNNNNTYTAEMGATTPDQHYIVDQLEAVNIVYTSSNGKVTQGLRITHATDFLAALVGRMQQKGGMTNIKVVDQYNKSLPLTDTQQLEANSRMIGGMSQNTFHETGYLKITFEQNGVQEAAELGTTVAGNLLTNNLVNGIGRTATRFTTENGTYVVGPTLYIVEPSKPSAARIQEAKVIASSVRCNPQFAAYCVKLALQMANNARLVTAEKIKQMQRDFEDNREKLMANFKEQMAERDDFTHDFCNYISNQQDFKSSNGTVVTIPNDYDHAWSNGQGGVYVSKDPTFNPGGDWESMQKTHAIGGDER